jgi:peptidoglycan/LPS O-acetylase OafA/YrhL
LWILVAVGAAGLCYAARHYGNLSVGWGADNFTAGGIRVFYSFTAGMLVYRSNWIIRSSLHFLLIGLMLATAFFVPFINELNWIIDPLIVIFYFPFLVALGAGARLTPGFEQLSAFSGAISYPLYMIHYPFLWLFLSYVEAEKPSIGQMTVIIPIATILLLCFAYLVMVFIDIPARSYLKKRMERRL